ncbi:MAG: transglycosylase domain-containing protein [Acidimicrobiales bacterium]
MPLLRRFLKIVVVAAACLAVGLPLLTTQAASIVTANRTAEGSAELRLNELSQRSVVYDRNGDVLAVLHAEENRSPVQLEQVPEHTIAAVLATEDDSFYDHDGINLRSILRAALTNARSGEVVQGGSTVTQQLVKNSLLTPDRDINRKVKEAVLALRLERNLSKNEILEQYLNTVYFGNGAYGLQAAAETYYGIGAADLDIGQSAFLAGVIRNPVGYDPLVSPKLAADRRDFVLDRMVTLGQITKEEAVRWKGTSVPSEFNQPLPTRDDYFVEEAKQRLLNDERLGETAQERYNAVFRGGLRIYTTFDPRLQAAAEKAARDKTPDTKGRFTSALVSLEPATGAVRAMVGGPGFERAKYNLATGRGGTGRQPGSSFKPFVLATAFDEGFGMNDIIDGTSPCVFSKKITGDGKDYKPENYEGSAGAWGPLWRATAKSYNCAFVRLGLSFDSDPTVSLQKVSTMAKRLGLKGAVDPVLAMPLGSEETTPLEMAGAYAVFANDGVKNEPYFVERVLDRNKKEVLSNKRSGERVLSEQSARMVTQSLERVVEQGTGTKARLPGRDVAGKTGTSEEWNDAWFVGFTPQLATAVWMGAASGQVPMRNVGGVRVTGGSYPASIWRAFMAEAIDPYPVARFTSPDSRKMPRIQTIKPKVKGVVSYYRRITTNPPAREPEPTTTTAPPTTAGPTTTQPPTPTPTTTPTTTTTTTPTTTAPPPTTSTTKPSS